MLPKTGDTLNPNNWRPIAILDVTYKIFAKVLHGRVAPTLEAQQPSEQMGFRRQRGTDDALLVLECVVGASVEWNSPIWFLSIDLTKAFDKIAYAALFQALEDQGVEEKYLVLLRALYSGQHGQVGAEAVFDICRGVRQGDVLSPCLFNAALEAVIRRWKSQLGDRGLQLDPARERLTNVRFADDLLLFGSSMAEVVEMFELLSLKLEEAGLSINPSKTKMFTTGALATSSVAPMMVDAAGSMVELVRGAATHKYLGRMFSGDLTKRGQCNLSHRLSCGWFKFHCFQHSLLNRKIPVHLRLRLFESVVSPTVLYSLSSTPLTATQQQKLDATQRKMLRRIVGWVHHSDEDWHSIGARMKARLDAALVRSPVRTWSEARNRQRERFLKSMETDQAP